MDETSGTSVADTSGNNNTGTANGATIVDGIKQKARNFTAGQYISIPDNNNYPSGTSDFTIDAWVNPATLAGDYRDIIANQGINQFQLILSNGGTNASIQIYLCGSGSPIDSVALSWNLGQWYDVSVTRISGVISIYRDGGLITSGNLNNSSSRSDINISYSAATCNHPW